MFKSLVILGGMVVSFGAASHPYEGLPQNAPLAFIEHRTFDNRPIYTNIPKKCFSHGRLVCTQLHPIFKSRGTIEKPGF